MEGKLCKRACAQRGKSCLVLCVRKLPATLFLGALLASCAAPPQAAPHGVVRYRYENSLDLRRDNTLNHVVVVGYDDSNIREATRLVVSAGGAPLTLANQLDVNGAMYAPAVELTKSGTLLVSWGAIDDRSESAELAADDSGGLTVIRRTHKP